jgi:outer membrane lipoprotein carrier protein
MNVRSTLIALSFLIASPVFANPTPRTPATSRNAQTRTPPRRPAPQRPAPQRPLPVAPAVTPVPVVQVQPVQPASPNTPLTADQVAQRIQDFYDRTTDFQADFVQLSRNRLYGEERRSGRVLFRKPGRMRWNYAAPHNDVIVSNGTRLTAYQAEEHQAIEQPLTQSQMPTALAFLTGTGRITDLFRFRLLDATQFRYPEGYVLELRPTTPQPSYERLVFYVDRASFQVSRTAIIDAQGNQNRFDFNNPQVNTNLSETTFQYTPPAGTQIIRP